MRAPTWVMNGPRADRMKTAELQDDIEEACVFFDLPELPFLKNNKERRDWLRQKRSLAWDVIRARNQEAATEANVKKHQGGITAAEANEWLRSLP